MKHIREEKKKNTFETRPSKEKYFWHQLVKMTMKYDHFYL